MQSASYRTFYKLTADFETLEFEFEYNTSVSSYLVQLNELVAINLRGTDDLVTLIPRIQYENAIDLAFIYTDYNLEDSDEYAYA